MNLLAEFYLEQAEKALDLPWGFYADADKTAKQMITETLLECLRQARATKDISQKPVAGQGYIFDGQKYIPVAPGCEAIALVNIRNQARVLAGDMVEMTARVQRLARDAENG